MAMSGLMYITGDPDKEPLATGGEPAEYFGGAARLGVAILAALEHRAVTGAGQHVDVSWLEALGCADEYNTHDVRLAWARSASASTPATTSRHTRARSSPAATATSSSSAAPPASR